MPRIFNREEMSGLIFCLGKVALKFHIGFAVENKFTGIRKFIGVVLVVWYLNKNVLLASHNLDNAHYIL